MTTAPPRVRRRRKERQNVKNNDDELPLIRHSSFQRRIKRKRPFWPPRNRCCDKTTTTSALLFVTVVVLWLFGCIHRRYGPDSRRSLLFGNRTAVQLHYETIDKKMQGAAVVHSKQPTIFYNVFIPHNDSQRALSIVQQQFSQMEQIAGRNLEIYVHSIGKPIHSELDQLCEKQQCRIQHHFQGSETVTLQHLYEYCLSQHTSENNHAARVVYLHSKGSFHDNRVNRVWNIALTAAALHPQCNKNNNSCAVCGLQFFTQFAMLFPGNMWSARCDYVRKLRPPSDFASDRQRAVERFLVMRLQGLMQSRLLRDRKDYFGLDRYNTEHWIGSHPDIEACDMEPSDTLTEVFRRNSNVDTILDALLWSRAPRHIGFAVGNNYQAHALLQKSREDRLREYFLLPGLLINWYTVYNRAPPTDSWIWKWFPDGEFWKEAIELHGAKAVETVAWSLAHNNPVSKSKFAQASSRHETTIASTNVVFYHISNASASEIIQKQMRIVSELRASSTIIMNMYGEDALSQRNYGLASCPRNVECRVQDVYEVDRKGETLQQLYDYCLQNPVARVTYINTRGMAERPDLIEDLTRAALDKYCLDPPDDSCNVCGLSFYTVWTLFFPGNMFTASCKYVAKLLPPLGFQEATERAVKAVLLAKLRNHIQFGLVPFSLNTSGLYDFDYWIGSHPDLKPCDLLSKPIPMDGTALGSLRWGMAPRHREALLLNRSKVQLPDQLFNESSRIREYQYLAGHLLKWQHLYHIVPPDESWIWRWFPDGRRWRKGVETFGIDGVVSNVTSEFAIDGV